MAHSADLTPAPQPGSAKHNRTAPQIAASVNRQYALSVVNPRIRFGLGAPRKYNKLRQRIDRPLAASKHREYGRA